MHNNPSQKTIGERIRSQRENYLGLSQEALAQATGLSRSAISQIELGNRKVTTIEINQISVALCCTIEYLIKGEDSHIPDDISHLARTAGALSRDDQKELLKFAQFLEAKKREKDI